MLFNSYIFLLVFLPITLIIFFGLSKYRLTTAATLWLVMASLIFYCEWSIAYLPLLLISIAVNYLVGKAIYRSKPGSREAKIWLWTGIGFNLLLLGYYKYANFFVDSVNTLVHTHWILPEIILPLGISFYTFTQTAFLVDIYRGEVNTYNFPNYGLFVTFFPHLIAGPILHHKDVIPQFQGRRWYIFSWENLTFGIAWFILGLFKKVAIADSLIPNVSLVFDRQWPLGFIETWVGALSYTFQLYFDFSGYSDMAVALGLMLNIQLPINFNSPYQATSISDFWRRWHITLSNFLRDYLYIPLGGSRKGEVRRYANLLITMLLGGLWHGAGWTFIVWGGMHGIFLCISHWWHQQKITLPKVLAWAITFIAVVFSWVLFRAHTLNDAIEIIKGMLGLKGLMLVGLKITNYRYWAIQMATLFILLLGVTLLPNTQQIMKWFKPTWGWMLLLSGALTLSFLLFNRDSEFLYFRF